MVMVGLCFVVAVVMVWNFGLWYVTFMARVKPKCLGLGLGLGIRLGLWSGERQRGCAIDATADLIFTAVGIACYSDGCICHDRVRPSVLRHIPVFCRDE